MKKLLFFAFLLASCSQQEPQSVTDGLVDSLYLGGWANITKQHEVRGYGTPIDLFLARETETTFAAVVVVSPTNFNDSLIGTTTLTVETFGTDVSNDPRQGYMQNRFSGDVVVDSLTYHLVFKRWRDQNYDGSLIGGVPDSELTVQFETEKKN